MKQKRFSDKQVIGILKEADAGVRRVVDLLRSLVSGIGALLGECQRRE